MQIDISKNKPLKLFFTFIFALVGFFFINTSKVYAGLDDSAMWGVTVNFDAKTFDGNVITNENGKYLEKYHSLYYCYWDTVPLKKLTSGMPKIGGAQTYNIFSPLSPKNKGDLTTCNTNVSDNGGNIVGGNKYSSYFTSEKLSESFSGTGSWSKGTEGQADAVVEIMSGLSHGEKWENLIAEDWAGHPKFNGKDAADWRKINAVFTWRGPNGAGDITEQEQTYMSKMSSILLNSYNDTIATILNSQNALTSIKNNYDKISFLDFAANLAVNVESPGTHTGTYGKITVTYKVEKVSDEEFKKSTYSKIQGVNSNYLRKISVQDAKGNTETILVIWKYPKGYANGQELAGKLSDKIKKEYPQNENISWSHAAYQGMLNFYSQSIDSYGMGDMYEKDDGGVIGRAFSSLINTIVTGISNILGLYSLEELCLNTGARGVKYWNGVFPSTWFSAAQYFYLFTFTISMLMLIISLVKLAGAKAASTIGNVAKRISLIEGTKKVVVCAVATMLFVPIFQILIQVNNTIVEVLKGIIPDGKELGFSVGATSGMGLAGAVIGIMIFWVTLKMNFTYILRAITILICYILGPIAIMCSAMGERFAMITSNWLKELVGNIFIQAIHAMIMMVYINIAGTGGIGSIEKLVIFYSFVPLTEFIRTNLFNLGKGLNDVADNLTSGISDAAGAVTSAAVMNRRFNSMRNANGSSASGDVTLKDKSSSLNNASGNAMPEGKVGFGDKVRAGMSGLGQGLKSGAVGGIKGVGRAAVNAPGALAHAGIAAGMALGSGAANSQGRMAMGATRAFGATVAEGINGTSGNIDRGFNGGFSEGYADGVNNYNSMKDLTENGLTVEEAKAHLGQGGLGLDLGNTITDDKGNTYAYISEQGKTQFANEGNGLKTYTDANGNSESAYIKDGKAYARVNISNAGKDSNGVQKFRISSAGNAHTIVQGQRNNATQAKARTQATINNAKSSAINVDTAKIKNATARENYTRVSK